MKSKRRDIDRRSFTGHGGVAAGVQSGGVFTEGGVVRG
jgi:hypothetical protein